MPVEAPPPAGRFSFFAPQAPVAQWYDVVADGHRLPRAAWTLEDDAVRDRVVLTWEPGLMEWTEEDEAVTGHPRDPRKRVEALPSSRRVEVLVDGVTVGSTDRPVLLFETDLPTRFYLPREDVRLDLLEPTDNTSFCPYKGRADSYWSWPGPLPVANLAWSYSTPAPAVAAIAAPGGLLQRARRPHGRRCPAGTTGVAVQRGRPAARTRLTAVARRRGPLGRPRRRASARPSAPAPPGTPHPRRPPRR